MKNNAKLLISALIALGSYQSGLAITPSEYASVIENKKKIENLLKDPKVENKKEIESLLGEIQKYDKNLAQRLGVQAKRKLNVEITPTQEKTFTAETEIVEEEILEESFGDTPEGETGAKQEQQGSEQEQERLERERQEQAKQAEQERLEEEQAKAEQERQEQLERERQEREQAEQKRLEQERLEQEQECKDAIQTVIDNVYKNNKFSVSSSHVIKSIEEKINQLDKNTSEIKDEISEILSDSDLGRIEKINAIMNKLGDNQQLSFRNFENALSLEAFRDKLWEAFKNQDPDSGFTLIFSNMKDVIENNDFDTDAQALKQKIEKSDFYNDDKSDKEKVQAIRQLIIIPLSEFVEQVKYLYEDVIPKDKSSHTQESLQELLETISEKYPEYKFTEGSNRNNRNEFIKKFENILKKKIQEEKGMITSIVTSKYTLEDKEKEILNLIEGLNFSE